MMERDYAMSLLDGALKHSTADQTEVILIAGEHGLTRLANNGIHQNVAVTNTTAHVRAVLGKRSGVATSNRLEGEGLRQLVERAIAIARVSEPNPDFTALPGEEPITPTSTPPVDPVALTPERRAREAGRVVETASGNHITASGHVSTEQNMLAVGNSHGVRAYHRDVQSSVMAIMTRDSASGYAIWDGRSLEEAPVAAIAGAASSKCLGSREPIAVEPGHYTVILEPPAVAELLSMLALIGLGATALQEDRSFMSGKIGEQLVAESVNLRDDAYHAGMLGAPFDYEGVPKRVVPFFERGVARGVVYDSYTAAKDGTHSTGHALPAPNAYGPLPLNLVLDTGGHTREELIRDVRYGILVTRFHYVNIVHPKETILTGMTRDGTFLIEHGALTRPVKNLRFTQSIIEALRHVVGLENKQALINQEGIMCLAPTLCINRFHFTSATA